MSNVGLWLRTPLMLAASRGHVDMTSFLVSAMADVNAVDIYQRTTLHVVVRHISSLLSLASVLVTFPVYCQFLLHSPLTVSCSRYRFSRSCPPAVGEKPLPVGGGGTLCRSW